MRRCIVIMLIYLLLFADKLQFPNPRMLRRVFGAANLAARADEEFATLPNGMIHLAEWGSSRKCPEIKV